MQLADSDYLGLIGKSFSVPEKTAMKLSLLVLGEKLHCRMLVWGKVMGLTADYLVAATVPEGGAATDLSRLYYYSIDGGTNWVLLPTQTLTAEQKEVADGIRGRFFGTPDFQYKVRKDVPPEPVEKSLVPPAEGALEGKGGEDAGEEKGDEEEEEHEETEEQPEGNEEEEEVDEEELRRLKNKPKYQILKLSEATRLAHFVVCHDAACRIIVRGSYVLNEGTNKVVRNRTFEGIDVTQAVKLRSYLKLSSFPVDDPPAPEGSEAAVPTPAPRTAEEKRSIISENNRKWFGPTYSASTDFLQPIGEDQPAGVWIVKYDASLPAVSVQNLFYKGSVFYCVPDSTVSGQFYYGTGERNLDVCFQLPCSA